MSTTNPPRPPTGLGTGGRALWRAIVSDHELDALQKVQLHEACRAKDRLDQLDRILTGDAEYWSEVIGDADHMTCRLQIAPALAKANDTANLMKQLLAALRLPDSDTGKRPQKRGPRGAQKPTVPGGADQGAGKVTSMDRHRERAARKSS